MTQNGSRVAPSETNALVSDETQVRNDGARADSGALQQRRILRNPRRRMDGDARLGKRRSTFVPHNWRQGGTLRGSDARAGTAGSRRTRIHQETSSKGQNGEGASRV